MLEMMTPLFPVILVAISCFVFNLQRGPPLLSGNYLLALLALVAPQNALTHKLFILQDRYADSKAVPPVDDQQDYELTDFQESDGKTLLKFKRKFDTCDPRDRKLEVSISADHFLLTEMPPQVYRCYSSALQFPPSFQPFLPHSHHS